MLTRREALTSIAATGLAIGDLATRLFGAGSDVPLPATPVTFAVPPNACDTHTHLFGDQQRYPYAPTSSYRHPPSTPDDMRALQKALHLERVVLIQPSAYASDNRCILDGVQALGARARAVIKIDDTTTDADLDRMHARGARGVRLNAGDARTVEQARQRIGDITRRIAGRPWHINTALEVPALPELEELLGTSSVPIVFDHFAGADAAEGTGQRGFASLVNLLKSGKVYVKLSRILNVSKMAPDYPDVAPIAKALIAANPQRILWGTDWPHAGMRARGAKATDISPYTQQDDGRVFNQFAVWAPDPAVRKTILVDNPAKLYGF